MDDRRENSAERRALANFRLYFDARTETLYDSMNHGKSHAGPLAHRTRGEERLEYALDRIRGHSVPRVADPQLGAPLRAGAVLPSFGVAQTAGRPATRPPHRLLGACAQIYQEIQPQRSLGHH